MGSFEDVLNAYLRTKNLDVFVTGSKAKFISSDIVTEFASRGDVGIVAIVKKNKEGRMTRAQLEIDFVCNLGSTRYYIQSAYSIPDANKWEKETRPYRKIDDSFKKL